jgi:ketosteroid isomerase-like protein
MPFVATEPREASALFEGNTDQEVAMQADDIHATAGVHPDAIRSVERVYELWDAALGAKDVDAAAALYAEDTRLESPLVRHLLGSERGIIEGRDRLRDFLQVVFERTPASRRRHRTRFFTDGRKLIWEYPRGTPDGDQMDFVESMEIENGLIRRHSVYWGWFGVKVLEGDRYHR